MGRARDANFPKKGAPLDEFTVEPFGNRSHRGDSVRFRAVKAPGLIEREYGRLKGALGKQELIKKLSEVAVSPATERLVAVVDLLARRCVNSLHQNASSVRFASSFLCLGARHFTSFFFIYFTSAWHLYRAAFRGCPVVFFVERAWRT